MNSQKFATEPTVRPPSQSADTEVQILNNMIEQDHRFIKRRVRHMCGFKSFRSASATSDGIEVANMIRKQQFSNAATSGFQVFAEIAG
ncbi:DDE-type integrase/transposase/recombinase [Ruegeria sp. EL01]|uniref:DDE-type integrase/transposase/recombinase n=1 Tax=Ruegeria sp. EL01 TaxID=2107578 RepID=UPI00352BF9B9